MVAVVAGHGEYARAGLPAGRPVVRLLVRSAVDSAGAVGRLRPRVPGRRVPATGLRAGGAVIPMMHVDDGTLDSAGHRAGGGRDEDLVLRVFDGGEAGGRVHRLRGRRRDPLVRTPHDRGRSSGTRVTRSSSRSRPRTGRYRGLADVRPLRIELVSTRVVSGVTVDGAPVPSLPAPSRTQAPWVVDPDRTGPSATLVVPPATLGATASGSPRRTSS